MAVLAGEHAYLEHAPQMPDWVLDCVNYVKEPPEEVRKTADRVIEEATRVFRQHVRRRNKKAGCGSRKYDWYGYDGPPIKEFTDPTAGGALW